jgi:hypothetical protein
MGGFKHTGAGAATVAGQYLVQGQAAANLEGLAVNLGTSGAPSYTFTGDSNTGMWSPAADTLAWSTAGIERARVAASGNFTIKEPSSGTSLTVIPFTDGTSGLAVDGSISGNIVGALIANRSNTAGSRARLWTYVEGAAADDAFHRFTVNGAADWAIGVDNSDSDSFKISAASALGSSDWFGVMTDGRLYGTALHNNASGLAGTAKQFTGSLTYTPTVGDLTNISSTSSASGYAIRVGNIVAVGVVVPGVNLTSSTPGTATSLTVTLPIATTAGFVLGSGTYYTSQTGEQNAVNLTISSNKALARWGVSAAGTPGTRELTLIFLYLVA